MDIGKSTNDWLTKSIEWRSEDVASLSCIEDQLNSCDGLAKYLEQLQIFVENKKISIDALLCELPSLGQLLGRLCSLPALLQDVRVFKPLILCLLALCSPKPISPVEHRAKSWALAQIKTTVSVPKNAYLPKGYRAHLFHQKCSAVIKHTISDIFQHEQPSAALDSCITICLHLVHESQFSSLLCDLMFVCLKYNHKQAMAKIAETQAYPYTKETAVTLPSQCLKLLWQSDPSFVEAEILDLVAAYHKNGCWENIKYQVMKRELPLIFVEFPLSWHLSNSLLLSIWNKSGHSAIITVMNGLTELTEVKAKEMPKAHHHVLNTNGGLSLLEGLVPYHLSFLSCCSVLSMLVNGLGKCDPDWLIQHQHWLTALILSPLLSTAKVSYDCSSLLSCFYHQLNKVDLCDFLDSLRALLHKSGITCSDIKCVLPGHCDEISLYSMALIMFAHIVNDIEQDTLNALLEMGCNLHSYEEKTSAVQQVYELMVPFEEHIVSCNKQLSTLWFKMEQSQS